MEQDYFKYRVKRNNHNDPEGFWEKVLTWGGLVVLAGSLIFATGMTLAAEELIDFD